MTQSRKYLDFQCDRTIVLVGMMGAGISLVSAMAGIEVVLVDRDQESADRGKAYSETYMDKGIAKRQRLKRRKPCLA